jgi:hypothetical protein
MFSQAFLTEGRAPWGKMQSIFALVRYFGGSEPLGWAFQWTMIAAVAVALVLLWCSRVRYSLKAAALATGTLLVTAVSVSLRRDGAGDRGGISGPDRAQRRLPPL